MEKMMFLKEDHHDSHRPLEEAPMRRMVVFLGPHKSASSSVQELFMKYAASSKDGEQQIKGNRRSHHPSLQNWTWPWNPRRRSYLPRKGFAPLVTENSIGFHQLIWDTLLDVWNNPGYDLDQAKPQKEGSDMRILEKPNIIWGSEELDRFGSTPWSHRDGIQAIDKVWNLLLFNSSSSTLESLKAFPQQQGNLQGLSQIQVDMVVNYRRPRSDQWVSIWKQLYRKKKNDDQTGSYAQFMCATEEYERIWEYLDCVANPLGLVQTLLDNFSSTASRNAATIHVLDMQGIASQKKDVGHILACDVLNVPCTKDRWLPGINHSIVNNQKSRPLGLTTKQLEDMEWVLQLRDCSYRTRLQLTDQVKGGQRHHQQSETRLIMHYADNMWDFCPSLLSTRSIPQFSNTTFLLELLQSQVGCGRLPISTIADIRRAHDNERTALLLQHSETRQYATSSIAQTLRLQVAIMSLTVFFMISFVINRVKRRRRK